MQDENVIRRFYEKLRKSEDARGVHIPLSRVFFIRRALADRTGVWYTIEHVEVALALEGWLDPRELKAIPSWYVARFMAGVAPDMQELRKRLEVKYRERQQALLCGVVGSEPDTESTPPS